MKITIQRQNMTVGLNTIGAYIDYFQYDGEDILYPVTTLTTPTGETKQRGGCHLCFPNFGAGGEFPQPPHGYARTYDWDIEKMTLSSATFRLTLAPDDYKGMHLTLEYKLTEHGLSMRLCAANRSPRIHPIAPAFHPYFMISKGERYIKINNEEINTNQIEGTEFRTDIRSLQLKKRTLQFQTESLPEWAIWSDKLDTYVCVEPTQSANSFLLNNGRMEQLHPNETRCYTFFIQL